MRSLRLFDEDTARVLVDTLAELVHPPLAGLASKEDLALAKAELRAEIQAVRAELRVEIQGVHVEIQGAKVETIRWVFGAAIGQVIAVIGLVLVGAVLALTR